MSIYFHSSEKRPSPGTPAFHPSDKCPSLGTPDFHPRDKRPSPGTPALRKIDSALAVPLYTISENATVLIGNGAHLREGMIWSGLRVELGNKAVLGVRL